MELLYSIDRALFIFLNQTISNPIGDVLWPIITDYDRFWPIRIVLGGVWLWLVIRGGTRGRVVAICVIPIIFLSDQVSSSIIKPLVARARPCHEIDGVRIVESVRLLVNCGPGKSFPSSHAVNNFAIATLFAYHYRKYFWWFYAWAFLVALSRPAVGVHYPSDVLAGGLIGILIAILVILLANAIVRRFFPEKERPNQAAAT